MTFIPEIGRWMEEDPIEFEAGDANLQRYVGNNPVNATDPTGLDEKCVTVKPVTVFSPKGGKNGAFVWLIRWQLSEKLPATGVGGVIVQHIKVDYHAWDADNKTVPNPFLARFKGRRDYYEAWKVQKGTSVPDYPLKSSMQKANEFSLLRARVDKDIPNVNFHDAFFDTGYNKPTRGDMTISAEVWLFYNKNNVPGGKDFFHFNNIFTGAGPIASMAAISAAEKANIAAFFAKNPEHTKPLKRILKVEWPLGGQVKILEAK